MSDKNIASAGKEPRGVMAEGNFKLWNSIVSLVVLAVAAVTYLMTIEPSASFWDCGEFIASSYKLEIGHPPGNPVFQLIARFFTMFTDGAHAAIAVNCMSAICSALTIFFLYLTIVFFAKRMVRRDENGLFSVGQTVAVFGSGAVGALAYCFSDTFWFSAVEGEVYAMSSLFTALVIWAMLKWYEQADQPYANRWIVLISFLMGLSIGVHLLNLLAIPALVFLFYYKQKENGYVFFWEKWKRLSKPFWSGFMALVLSAVILAVVLFIIIPLLPKMAAAVDLLFVNGLSLPFNSGAAFFMLALFALCFWGLFATLKRGRVMANTILLCFTTIVIGFSIFSICIIRSSVKTPTNEYQPDNAYTLVRYLSREQYGSTPLLYGQYFDAPLEVKIPKYWARVGDRYVRADGQLSPKYTAEGKMLFPRMWNSDGTGKNEEFYETYMNGRGKVVPGQEYKKPRQIDNIRYFIDYQCNWMYWRYFMWNFAGRQNDIHSPVPGDIFIGNWESGIGPLDRARLGDQRDAPAYLSENKGKNHYYMLPLLFGILGIFYQFLRDKKGTWVVFLVFFMTGLAVVIYLNQPPYQVRERDYAYAGSFYAFSIWIGFAVLSIYDFVVGLFQKRELPVGAKATVATVVSLICLGVPALMAQQNWDDHDRSNRKTALELAWNYLNAVGLSGILVTHGDNDTFPLWYAQEVEGVRTDVRICNTSLLGTDWHIDQMKYACNESAPLDLSVGLDQYLYGTNEFVYIYDSREAVIPISTVMEVFRHPLAKVELTSGRKVDYIMSRRISIPVIKENVLKYGILPEKYADQIPDEIILYIPASKDYLTKPELFMLDLLSNYKWDRPISLLSMGGDLNMGIKDFLMYDGVTYRFVPIRNKTTLSKVGFTDPDHLYYLMKNVFKWDALKRTDYYVDYFNFYTFCGVMSQRWVFWNVASALKEAGENEKAVEILDMCQECVPASVFPLDISYLGFSNEQNVLRIIDLYFNLGADEKALGLAAQMAAEMMVSARFYLEFYDFAKDEFELEWKYIMYLVDTLEMYGYKEAAEQVEDDLNKIVEMFVGDDYDDFDDEDFEALETEFELDN